jgi:predicted metal-dependent hydrolase
MNKATVKRAFCLLLLTGLLFVKTDVFAQNAKLFLGIKLRAEVQALADEIENKTKRKISAHFVEYAGEERFMLGSSFIHSDGVPYLAVSIDLTDQPKKAEAVIAHELLHLRLRANGYPVFLFDS